MPMIDAAIHDAVMALPPDERRDRAKGGREMKKRLLACEIGQMLLSRK